MSAFMFRLSGLPLICASTCRSVRGHHEIGLGGDGKQVRPADTVAARNRCRELQHHITIVKQHTRSVRLSCLGWRSHWRTLRESHAREDLVADDPVPHGLAVYLVLVPRRTADDPWRDVTIAGYVAHRLRCGLSPGSCDRGAPFASTAPTLTTTPEARLYFHRRPPSPIQSRKS